MLCLGGGTLAVFLGHPELLMLRSDVGCGDSSSGSGIGDGIGNLLSKLLN